MKSFLICICGVFILLISCNGSESIDNEDVSTIEWDSLSDKEVSYCDEVKVVCLSDVFLGDVLKVIFDDSLIFVHDSHDRVLKFNSNGQFLSTIGRKGHSNKEYVQMVDFYIDKQNKHVGIVDISKGIISYDYDGNYVSSNRLFLETDCKPNILKIDYISKNQLLCQNYIWKDYPNSFSIVTLDDQKFYDFVPNIVSSDPAMEHENYISECDEGLFFGSFFSDTIYTVSDNIVKPSYVFNGPMKHACVDDFNTLSSTDVVDYMSYAWKHGISVGINRMFMTNNLIYFNYEISIDECYRIIYDKNNCHGYKWNTNVFSVWDCLIAIKDDYFVGLTTKIDFVDIANELNYDVKQLNDIDDDTQILFFFRPKL